jgi:hypothetical protein
MCSVARVRLNWPLNIVWKDVRLLRDPCYIAQLSLDWKNRRFRRALMTVHPTTRFIRDLNSATGKSLGVVAGMWLPSRTSSSAWNFYRKISWRRTVISDVWRWKLLNFLTSFYRPKVLTVFQIIVLIIISARRSNVWFGCKSYR